MGNNSGDLIYECDCPDCGKPVRLTSIDQIHFAGKCVCGRKFNLVKKGHPHPKPKEN